MPGRLSLLRTIPDSLRPTPRGGGVYSYVVVAAWLPLYLLVYWLPRP
ncbi:MAG TPA: hypothetical protein VIG37_11350 [Methylomirabilota bacterium]